jgi:hypothetical protein
MPSTNQKIKERVVAAYRALETQSKPNIAKTAREFNAPLFRVRRRFRRETQGLNANGGYNKILNKKEKTVLREYIDFCEYLGFPLRKKSLQKTANDILRRRYS